MVNRQIGSGLTAIAIILFFISTTPAGEPAGQSWNKEWDCLVDELKKGPSPAHLEREVVNPQALIMDADRDPLDVVQRRTAALLASRRNLAKTASLSMTDSRIKDVQRAAQSTEVMNVAARQELFAEVMAANRDAMMANPVMDFDTLIANIETFLECRMVECARASRHLPGGGPVMITGIRGASPQMRKILSGVKVASGPWAGRELTGKFAGLELGFDAKEILFSATTDDNLWHIFRFNLASKMLDQLTSGPYDDFDPCFLPSGRIVFVSTRRGGIGRCLLPSDALTFTLYSMESDGSDIIPISYHETNEWQPSVNNDGMIVYNRWDYFDRHWGTAHHLFLCNPDGRDPRNWHGNYPLPRDVMPDGITPRQYGTEGGFQDGRRLREDVDMSLRAIPGTNGKFTATAVGHHEGFSGTLILIDVNIPDDGKMSQVKRLTPEVRFPEVEGGTHTYGTCWPLDETTFLCNYNQGIYVIDDMGNRQKLYDPGNLEGRGNTFRLRDPIPLRPRTKPKEISVHTFQGKRASLPDHQPATISVLNCYLTDSIPKPIPAGTKIKWMRIIQIIPQLLKHISGGHDQGTLVYMSSYDESTGRIPLGVVPVEEDGSVYCEAPAGKALYFQLLDSNGIAVHSMRTVAYTHAGEQLTCSGCHEDKWKATPVSRIPIAFSRPPSRIEPEVSDGAVPFNFHRLVEWPVFQKKCLPCHRRENRGLTDMSYEAMAKYHLAFGFQGEVGFTWRGSGGSRTTPGRFGAAASGIWKELTTNPAMKDVLGSLTPEEIRRLTLWLDMNSNRLCWEDDDKEHLDAQRRGDVLWPPIDVSPYNPTGVEFIGTDNVNPEPLTIVQKIKESDPVQHVLLRWSPGVDGESGVGAYNVYRDNRLLCMVPDLMYVDRSTGADTTSVYEVAAVDRTGNEGPKSRAVPTDPTSVEGVLPPVHEKTGTELEFCVRTIVQPHAIMVKITAPEKTAVPAHVSLYSINGKLIGRLVAERSSPGNYTGEFRTYGSTGVYLCRIAVGPYRRQVRIVNQR